MKIDTQRFEFNLEDNLFELREQLISETWRHGSYQAFYVRDPKLRHIHKATVRDRVLHQAVFRVLYPIFDRTFIRDSYSCRVDKGTHSAVSRLEAFAHKASRNHRRTVFALKCDVRKFFDSVDQEILLGLIRKRVVDDDALWLIGHIIRSFETKPGKALPLGNVTSQLFANIYLNELDQFVKRELRERHYIRYCDDFIILHEDADYLRVLAERINLFLHNVLRLELHADKIIIRKHTQGIDFLGYVVLPHHRVLRTKTKRRVFRKVAERRDALRRGEIDAASFHQSLQSYFGILAHCKGAKIRDKIKRIVMAFKIPKEVLEVAKGLEKAGFEAYLVGGCVRDLLLNREPKDWDIATNAKPEQVQKIFTDSVYENEFGTVGVKIPTPEAVGTTTVSVGADSKKKIDIVEVTTFRTEGRYTDKRHPEEVKFVKTIEEDLSRRDFTINAVAMSVSGDITDPYGGRKDLSARVIRTVGKSEERFTEDALRLFRAVRFAAELGFEIEKETKEAIKKHAGLLEAIAKERIRDEFAKLIMTERAADGIRLLEDVGLLKFVLPELREGINVGQNKHHIYNVFDHNLRSLDYAAKQNYSLAIRLASLLHDIGKPKTKGGDGSDSTFHGHEVVGAKMAAKALDRLRFSKDLTEDVVHLVRYHMFYYNVGEVSEAGVRRFLVRVGPEYVDDLLKVREADRIGSGVPKAVPYKLRHLLFMIEKVKHDPISPKMLKVNGEDVMKITGIEPGPKVGQILSALLEEVLDDPKRNEKDYLEKRIEELNKLSEKELLALAQKARETKEEIEAEVESEMKKRHYVK